ncbi:hypothetical protein [Nostoc sp.]|uniref:hypothetical protein n=1 Tax=Nostoc sp. TaxID=1180 RepID=UPI002FFCF0CC
MTLTKNLFLYFFLRFLVFSIIPLSFLFAGCNNEDENKAMDEKISRLEKEAENHLRYKIQEQQSYFSKHKTFFKPPDERGTNSGYFPPIFGTQICYGYYTEINADVLSKTTIDAIYSTSCCYDVQLVRIKMLSFYESIFNRSPRKNSYSTYSG